MSIGHSRQDMWFYAHKAYMTRVFLLEPPLQTYKTKSVKCVGRYNLLGTQSTFRHPQAGGYAGNGKWSTTIFMLYIWKSFFAWEIVLPDDRFGAKDESLMRIVRICGLTSYILMEYMYYYYYYMEGVL